MKKLTIQKLDNSNPKIAEQIRDIWQVSYPVEAKMLGAKVFPPLERSLEDFISCENTFWGYFNKEELAAVTEIIYNSNYTHIRSLVVDPRFFRQGIASELVQFTLSHYNSALFIVETGEANGPACALYKKFDFELMEACDTPFGIRKVRFEKHLPSD